MASLPACPAIAGYVVLRALGSGQFGDVHLVRRTRDARLFAAKVPRGGGDGDGDAQEARLLQKLQHPNIVYCEEIVRVDAGRRLVIIMEYAAMGDLEEYLRGFAQRKEPIPEGEIMRIFLQIALALTYLHEQRVLHRDLKPKNVLLDARGVVKLSDFGVSRSLQHTLDAAHTITGTPYYMSPELMDNQPYDGKADVWSLGCILFELATLAPPFAAKALAALVMQIVSQPPPSIPHNYSRELDALAKKLLAKDPSNRPSIREVLAEPFVQQHLVRLASTASVDPAVDRGSHISVEVINPPTHQRYESSPVQLSRPVIAVAPAMFGTPLHNPTQVDDDVALRRKMFFENQAAAQRNKDRVALEKARPPVFLHHDVVVQPPAERARNSRAPVQSVNSNDMDAAPERAKQFYLENARAAKLNKQRAIDAMKGHAEVIVCAELDPLGHSPGDVLVAVVTPPPAPVRKDNKAYEALLEEERRRVRMDRKLLHERMREQQNTIGTASPQVTTATRECVAE